MHETKRILVVEDEPAVRRLVARMLRAANYEVREAEDGWAAWDLAQTEKFDLVVTDSHMPRMSGPELISRLRHVDATLPIIQVSGSSPDADKDYELPADVPTMFKPFQLELLVEEVQRFLSPRSA